ncbi:YLP motif protein (macronuclear) [Tetrahymena thermophila SB210]|uniref:YLP motif protein n=1 Tax=Tetrahymena thermophila (strain SB210) TaxID=312017 RepID=Q245M0_TETTS|nr:YLP motif protein [Tetrahymena thermophila SB210]EAS03613.2 YLP motif protein [Tetrahymena thermophila SB210]|eukprot:XP_001023858.2 YLP motif protein [Tetrahymena thermophila SB210]
MPLKQNKYLEKIVALIQRAINFANSNKTHLTIIALMLLPTVFCMIITFLSIKISQLITQHLIDEFAEKLFEDQIQASQILNTGIVFQLNFQMQKLVWQINLLNEFQGNLIQNKVKKNSNHIPTILNIDRAYNNDENPLIMNLFQKNDIYVSSWHQVNETYLKDLNQIQIQQMDYAVRQDSIWKAIKYENDNQNQRYLKIDDIQIGYDQGGLFYLTGKNITYNSYEIPSGCPYTGQFRFDVRCRFYYQPTMNNISIAIFDPQIIYNNVTPYLGSIFCQRRLKYQNTNLSDDGQIYSLLCITLDISQVSNYFLNFASNSVAKIVLDPRKLTIVYDSQQKITSVGLNTLYQTEIDFLQNKIDGQNFLENIKQMSQFVLDSQDSIKELNLSPKSIQNDFQYNRNGTECFVSQNLITVIDKVPKGETLKKINPSKKFQLKGVFIYLDLISKQKMTQYSQNLTDSIENLNHVQIYCSLSLLIILIGFKLYYSIILGYQILYPIAHLTNVLKQIQIVSQKDKKSVQKKKQFTQNLDSPCLTTDKSKSSYYSDNDSFNQIQISFDVDQDFEGVCFSQDTQELLFIFQNMFQILQSINKHFFNQDESAKLLKLNRQVKHFESIKNYSSLGVCFNNIGVIHYNNQRYQESIKNFQKSIIYANYELNVYSHNNPKYDSSNKHKSENQNIKDQNKQDTYLEYLNFQQEGEDTYSLKEIEQLYQNLYNRKLNLVKALFHFLIDNPGMWDIFQEKGSELLQLTKNFLGQSKEREMLTHYVMLKSFYFTNELSRAKDTLNILSDLYTNKFEINEHQKNKKQEQCQFQIMNEIFYQNKECYVGQLLISPIRESKKQNPNSIRSKKGQSFSNNSQKQDKDESFLLQELINQEKQKDPLQIKENFFETQNNSVDTVQYESKKKNSNDKNQLNLEQSSQNIDTYYMRPKVNSIFKKQLEHRSKLQREENIQDNLEKGKQEKFHQKFINLCQNQYSMEYSRRYTSQYPLNSQKTRIIRTNKQDKQTNITFYKLKKTKKKNQQSEDYEFNSDIYFQYYALSQAQYQIKINNQYTAATILTNCFEKCKYYLPHLKLQALNMLHRIFSQCNIKDEFLEEMKTSYEQMPELGGCVWINKLSVQRPYL